MRGAGLATRLLLALCWLCSAAPGQWCRRQRADLAGVERWRPRTQSFVATLRQSLPPALLLSVVERRGFICRRAGRRHDRDRWQQGCRNGGGPHRSAWAVMLPHRKYADLLARRSARQPDLGAVSGSAVGASGWPLRAALPERSQIGAVSAGLAPRSQIAPPAGGARGHSCLPG